MESEAQVELDAKEDVFDCTVNHGNVDSTPDATLSSTSPINSAVLSALLNVREPSFLDTQIWHSKSSSQSQQSLARSKKAAIILPSVSSPPRHIIAPVSQAAMSRHKLTLGDEQGMFDPVRRYNEVAQRMKASISRALARSVPSPRTAKIVTKPSPSPVVGDSKLKLWAALPAVPRLFCDLQRAAAGGMGRLADIGASHWLAWCSDQEALGRVPHVTRAAGLEALIASGCNGSFKLSLEQFSQCILVLATRVLELESTQTLPSSLSEPSPHAAAIPSSDDASSPADPATFSPAFIPSSAPKPRARACSSQHVSLCKSFIKRLATANVPSPPVHERSRRSCKSSVWYGKVPAIDKLYNQLGGAPFSRAAFVSAVVSALGEGASCSEDLLGFAFDWAGNICNNGPLSDNQAVLDYDGLWQAVLYACGYCNSSSAPPIRCSGSALRAVHAWSSSWTFTALQSPPTRTAVLPSIGAARPVTISQDATKIQSSAAAVSNYSSILGDIDPNYAEKSHAEVDETDNQLIGHSVSFATQPSPAAPRNLSPTRLPSSRGDRDSVLESRSGSRSAARHQESSRPVTGIGGFSLPTVNERLRTSPIKQHGTTTLVSGVVKSPGPNPLLKQPHPVLDKTFACRVNQAKFTFQPEFSSQRVFGHFVSRDVVLGPVPRHLLNIPATADPSFKLQASPPRRYPEGKNINPQWANKLDVNDELFDKSLKGHEVCYVLRDYPLAVQRCSALFFLIELCPGSF
jgi:hypothetical protein